MTDSHDLTEGMSPYDRASWRHLEEHWKKKSKRREILPPKARDALGSAGRRSREVVSEAGRKLGEHTPESLKRAGEFVFDEALVPAVKAAANLLELAEQSAAELMNPEAVLEYHRTRGRSVFSLADMRVVDLEHLDRSTRQLALRWRGSGALEGAAMGLLAFVPGPGTAASLTADFIVMQVLGSAIATRTMYSYGYDAQHPDERQAVERIVRRAFRAQVPKARAVHQASQAFNASRDRVRWSEKLRNDHRLMAAVEKLMKQVGDGKVSVQDVSKKMPYIGIVTNAGSNAYLLGDIAKQGIFYGRTRHLSEKYDLPLPTNLVPDADEDEDSDDEPS